MASSPIAVLRTYAELRRGVQETLLAGQRRIDQAKLETYWRTGRLVHGHVDLHPEDTGHGTQTIHRLARDLDLDESLLYRCVRFARAYPIFAVRQNLVWAHYRLLSFVEDVTVRKALEVQASKQSWSADHLSDRIRSLAEPVRIEEPGASSPQKAVRLLTAKHGTPGLYPVVERKSGLALDIGFKLFVPFALIPGGGPRGARAGDIVRVTEENTLVRDSEATRADLFTYRCSDLRVVDGDTLAVTVASPPHNDVDKKLRLRGLNCPEMDTAAGKAAKRFAQQLVDTATSVILTTTKPDKYDRYLADVFITTPSGEEIYLNNALLENGHADRMDASAPPPELL